MTGVRKSGEERRLLVFNPGSQGGIQKYAFYQAVALQRQGFAVVVLCDADNSERMQVRVPTRRVLISDGGKDSAGNLAGKKSGGVRKARRLIGIARQILGNQLILCREVLKFRPDVVLLASYSEYLAPLWCWLQMVLARSFSVTFVAGLHDPVRAFQVGPGWWHRLSVQMAYWPLSAVFLHEEVPANAGVPARVKKAIVPHGLFALPESTRSVDEVRKEWGVPDSAIVFLSFGFIRDGKNLDLLIRATAENEGAYLVVMGRVQSISNNRPIEFYTALAKQLGVGERVRFRAGFVPEEDLRAYLASADVIAMTYSAGFRSQSGVLNAVAQVNKPVLASAGDSPLKDCVARFGLGEFVAPDSAEAVTQGMKRLCELVRDGRRSGDANSPFAEAWAAYRAFASWDINAELVSRLIGSLGAERTESAMGPRGPLSPKLETEVER